MGIFNFFKKKKNLTERQSGGKPESEIAKKIAMLVSAKYLVREGLTKEESIKYETLRSRFFEYIHNHREVFSDLLKIEREFFLTGTTGKSERIYSDIQQDFVLRVEIFHEQTYKALVAFSHLLFFITPNKFGNHISASMKTFLKSNIGLLDGFNNDESLKILVKSRDARSKFFIHPRKDRYWMTVGAHQNFFVLFHSIESGDGKFLDLTPVMTSDKFIEAEQDIMYDTQEEIRSLYSNDNSFFMMSGIKSQEWFLVPHHILTRRALFSLINKILDYFLIDYVDTKD